MQNAHQGFVPKKVRYFDLIFNLAKALQIDLGQAQSRKIKLVFTPINKRDQKNIGGDNGTII
jgi:hypothetical protein